MDIHIPDNLGENERVPAVITIYGGNWSVDSGVTKDYYNYMTDFITNTCRCVHVNMEYRRLGNNGGLSTGEGALVPYQQMLADIQLVIDFISKDVNAAAYHIDPNKIALMGWSAGGHLALLYAYSTADNYTDQANNPIKLVISEAGPTDFLMKDEHGNPISPDQNICDLVGIMGNDLNINDQLFDSSPIKYVTVAEGEDTVDVPYTMLVYGNGISCGILGDGDGVVAYSQATSLAEKLDVNKYTLFTLYGVSHLQFGEGKTVYPEATDEMIKEYYSCDDFNKPGLKQLINTYLLGNTNNN